VTDDDRQRRLPFLDQPDNRKRIYRISRRQARVRRSLPMLPLPDTRFAPVAGVPATRGDCPTQRPCPHVRCRHHLYLEDAEHRAGRPGLASVPRDSRGWTLPSTGNAGAARPGTTLHPGWLELERHCKGWIEVDEAGEMLCINVDQQQWRGMRLHDGEALRVVSEDGGYATTATWIADEIKLDRVPPFMTVALLITRVRGVPSCALDEIDRLGEMSNEQTGDAVGRHRTLVAREVKRALAKGARRASEMYGMSEAEFVAGLRELRMENGRG
jgi:hypothetical protein